jgi:hypothetical protein
MINNNNNNYNADWHFVFNVIIESLNFKKSLSPIDNIFGQFSARLPLMKN